jgi:hypothetical protein
VQRYEPDAWRCPACDEREQQPIAPTEAEPHSATEPDGSVPNIAAPAASLISDLDSYLDEIETLLRRAKQMVRDPVSPSRPVVGLTDNGHDNSDC